MKSIQQQPRFSQVALAIEMVYADNQLATAVRTGNLLREQLLRRYREDLRSVRSAMLRFKRVPRLSECPVCRFVIETMRIECALACPYCGAHTALDRWSRV